MAATVPSPPMRLRRPALLLATLAGIAALAVAGYWGATYFNLNPAREVGTVVDEFNGVKVYYNGGVNAQGGNWRAEGGTLGWLRRAQAPS